MTPWSGRSRCGVTAQSSQARSDIDIYLKHRLPPRSGYGLLVFQRTWDETVALLLRLALGRESTDSAMKILSLYGAVGMDRYTHAW
jgi:hypothetical protein